MTDDASSTESVWGEAASSRKRPSQARSRATFEAILEATAELLVVDGYEKTSTNRIAERAGVSVGSLYQYFPNKEALLIELAERNTTKMMALIQEHLEVTRDIGLPEACRSFVRALLHAHAVAPKLHRILIEQIPRIAGFGPIQHYDELIINVIRGYLQGRREELRPQNLDLAVFVMVHAVQAVTHAAVIERPDALEDEALAEEIATMVERYLLADPGSTSAVG